MRKLAIIGFCWLTMTDVISAEPPLHVLVENAATPYSNPDGTGYANDVVRAAFHAVGVKVKLMVVPYVRSKAQVMNGTAVACVSMSWDESFAGKVKFSEAVLLVVAPVYFERRAQPLAPRSEGQLGAGMRIGTIRGYEYPHAAMQVRARGAVFEDGISEIANLKKLAAGRLDGALVMSNPLTGVSHWLKEAGVEEDVREAFRSGGTVLGYLGASLLHPQGPQTLEKFNDGMRRIERSGELERIRQRWHKGED